MRGEGEEGRRRPQEANAILAAAIIPSPALVRGFSGVGRRPSVRVRRRAQRQRQDFIGWTGREGKRWTGQVLLAAAHKGVAGSGGPLRISAWGQF
uniref:Uncharacterized protein n=1 Tax=Arundo donax TaxID=35708 RepID=A0A0A9HWV0_ARUDO